jgi:hypothetical protein
MGEPKAWMFSVNPEVVESLDELADELKLRRTQTAHTALSLGLRLLKQLGRSENLKDLLDKEPKAQPAKTSVVKAKGRKGSTPHEIERDYHGTDDPPFDEGLEPPEVRESYEEPASSPSESVSDTVPPSRPIEAVDSTEDLLEAVLGQLDAPAHNYPRTGNLFDDEDD